MGGVSDSGSSKGGGTVGSALLGVALHKIGVRWSLGRERDPWGGRDE